MLCFMGTVIRTLIVTAPGSFRIIAAFVVGCQNEAEPEADVGKGQCFKFLDNHCLTTKSTPTGIG